MNIEASRKHWDRLASRNTHWSIRTRECLNQDRISESYFFRTGQKEVFSVMNKLDDEELLPENRALALDFGCGIGRLSRALTRYFSRVVGLDSSPYMIEQAQSLHHERREQIEFYVNTENDLSLFESDHFSCIYSSFVLQFIPKPLSLLYLVEFLRVLKPGGRLIFQLPTKDVRSLSLWRKAYLSLKIPEQLAFWGMTKNLVTTSFVMPFEDIEKVTYVNQGEILATFTTNHMEPEFDGTVKWIPQEQATEFISTLFIIRKN